MSLNFAVSYHYYAGIEESSQYRRKCVILPLQRTGPQIMPGINGQLSTTLTQVPKNKMVVLFIPW